MKFDVLVSRKLIDRGAADPYGRVWQHRRELRLFAREVMPRVSS